MYIVIYHCYCMEGREAFASHNSNPCQILFPSVINADCSYVQRKTVVANERK